MTDLMAGEIIATAVLVFGVACLLAWECRDATPDAGVDILEPADVDEDINNPSLATIDEALRHVDRDSNPDAVDWLLERRIDAMRRAS